MSEIWKDVIGFESLYQVSNIGRVKSMSLKRGWIQQGERILAQSTTWDGYFRVGLTKGGKRYNYGVQRLVALAFIPNPENKPIVNHINGIKKDNRVENLEWVTERENSTHYRVQQPTTSKYVGVHWGKKERKWKAQIQINNKVLYLGVFKTEEEAHEAYLTKLNNLLSSGGV